MPKYGTVDASIAGVTISGRREELARLLRRGRQYTIALLADELGVSRRTVLRDLDALRSQGYRIDGEGGPGGGVRMDPSTVMLSGQLAAREVVGLIISVSLLRASPWLPFAGDAERAVAKLEKALPSDRIRDLRRLLQRVLVGAPSRAGVQEPPGPIDENLLMRFEHAFTAHLCLEFDYVDRRATQSRRCVEPQALLVRAPIWYVIAWDPSRDGLRLFRMDRIRGPRVMDSRPFELRRLSLITGVCPDAKRESSGRSARKTSPPRR